MATSRATDGNFPRYWTWDEIQSFLLDNDLAIAEGMGDDDDMALTARGEELFDVLAMAKHLGGGMPR
jgi:hypothetical protein